MTEERLPNVDAKIVYADNKRQFVVSYSDWDYGNPKTFTHDLPVEMKGVGYSHLDDKICLHRMTTDLFVAIQRLEAHSDSWWKSIDAHFEILDKHEPYYPPFNYRPNGDDQ